MYLSSFLGRTITHVLNKEKHTVFKFSDFSMIFLHSIDTNHDLEHFLGQKFLYIQKDTNKVHFHFSGALAFSVKIESPLRGIPQYIMLKSKEKEVLLRVDDGKTFEGF